MSAAVFWSHISSERDARIVQEILRRNHGGALIFDLDESNYSNQTDTERTAVLELALAQIHRWKTFFFAGKYREELFTDIGRRASTLEELFVDLTVEGVSSNHVIRLSDGQSLRHLSLCGIGLDGSSSRLAGLWSLTLASIEQGPSLAQFHAILSSSPLLHFLFLESIKSNEPLAPSMSSIQLPFLSDICLYAIPSPLISFLISHIETSACISLVTEKIDFPLHSRVLTLASNAIRRCSRLEIRYDGGPQTTRIETQPGPIARRFRGGICHPGASLAVKGARLDEVLLHIVDAFTCGKVDPTVLVHVSRSADHEDSTFVGAQVVLKGFQELCLPLRTFLLEKVSREWLGEKAFIYELGEALGKGVDLNPPGW